jgi:hypothetical protein
MEHGTHPAQGDADPTSGALADLSPGSAQQRLDVIPAQIGGRRFREYPLKCAAVTAVHGAVMS